MSVLFNVFENQDTVASAAADYIHQQIQLCLQLKPTCHIALPGGTTPEICLQLLSTSDIPWEKIEWYLGDERCLPVGDEERNDTMIKQSLFKNKASHEYHFHPIESEMGAELAATRYSSLIDSIERFDLIVLGMGEDGHTASLFPNNKALEDNSASVIPVYDSPKPPSDRVSLSIKTIAAAKERIIIATGDNKNVAIDKFRSGESLPISLIGDCHWFVDSAAYGDQTSN